MKASTVDGQNPAPVILSTGFYPSQVVQDFVHQQYFPAALASQPLRPKNKRLGFTEQHTRTQLVHWFNRIRFARRILFDRLTWFGAFVPI